MAEPPMDAASPGDGRQRDRASYYFRPASGFHRFGLGIGAVTRENRLGGEPGLFLSAERDHEQGADFASAAIAAVAAGENLPGRDWVVRRVADRDIGNTLVRAHRQHIGHRHSWRSWFRVAAGNRAGPLPIPGHEGAVQPTRVNIPSKGTACRAPTRTRESGATERQGSKIRGNHRRNGSTDPPINGLRLTAYGFTVHDRR